ncbi:MAG: transglycosylase SLT domain-containing protein, partial [Acidobacteriota bacterium]|nr:transglycosylase SLT domain-containing protein [Acidobacteriota bacterium]
YPASPLRPRALQKAAKLAWQQGDTGRALEAIEQARREGLRGEEASQLEALAWEIGTRQNDATIRLEAARRLLVDSPALANQLGVAEIFRPPSGTLLWSQFLSVDQLKRRAQALLALQLAPNALAALAAVDLPARDLDWQLLEAETLTRDHRGLEALAVLAAASAAEPRQAAALEWARAMAAIEAATVQRGRGNLVQSDRLRERLAARQSLERVVQLGADPALSIKALRLLYTAYHEEEAFDRSIEVLRKLRQLDPADITGAASLWAHGWQEYSRANYTGAVGYWSELTALYPRDTCGRRGRYWTARAYEALGETARAQGIYAEVASSDTTDFYRKNALLRLHGKSSPAAAPEPAVEPWPSDPLLARARLLTDLGLDDLATSEMELVRGRANPRAASALAALILAHQGDRRKSVLAIRDALPALGGPYQASVPEEALKLYYPLEYQEAIRASARMNHIPPYLVLGIIRQESAFDAHATSWAGARGLMQLMPATARELARGIGLPFSSDRMADPAFNVQIGTTYLRQVLGMFDGNVELALAGYNGGPYRIKRLWREARTSDLDRFLEGLSIEESKVYVKRILVLSDSYRRLYPEAG